MKELSDVKKGDFVGLRGAFPRHRGMVERKTVIHVTATTFTLEGGRRFYKASGKEIGGSDSFKVVFARAWTEEDEIAFLRAKMIDSVKNIDWNDVDDEVLKNAVKSLSDLGLIEGV